MDLNHGEENEEHLPELTGQLPSFLKSRADELSRLKELIHESKYDDVLSIVHDWKGFSEPYGFKKLVEIGTTLESCAMIRNPQKCYSTLEKIGEYLSSKECSLRKKGLL